MRYRLARRPGDLQVSVSSASLTFTPTTNQAVVGTTKDARGTPLWAADEVVYAPAIAVSGVHVDAIAGFMEGLD